MKPILFNTEMVRAILDGRKSVTRRVVKPPALDRMILDAVEDCIGSFDPEKGDVYPTVDDCRYQPGDILYVRETWAESQDGYSYKADYLGSDGWGWRPSIHMPKEAARLFLRVTDVQVERLQDIRVEDIAREGIFDACGGDDFIQGEAYSHFEKTWDSTLKKADLPRYGWAANPWVFVIEFERISGKEVNIND